MNFISGNYEAETKEKAINTLNGRCRDFIITKEHYKGIGVFAVNIYKDNLIISNLFYSDEKPPHMGWFDYDC